jgi:hypothetical protein
VVNGWDFSKLKHKEPDDLADLKPEASRQICINSTAPDYHFKIKEAYTFAEVQQITLEATQNLSTHLMKSLFINKLVPTNKDFLKVIGFVYMPVFIKHGELNQCILKVHF